VLDLYTQFLEEYELRVSTVTTVSTLLLDTVLPFERQRLVK
jgi:hypothetical protein